VDQRRSPFSGRNGSGGFDGQYAVIVTSTGSAIEYEFESFAATIFEPPSCLLNHSSLTSLRCRRVGGGSDGSEQRGDDPVSRRRDEPRRRQGLPKPLLFLVREVDLSELIGAFDPLRLDEELLIGDDRFVCARWQLRGTQVGAFMGEASHGNSIDVATCEIYEIADDLVVESWVYQDPGQMFTQMAAGQTAGSSS
jgi:hypothetical protein